MAFVAASCARASVFAANAILRNFVFGPRHFLEYTFWIVPDGLQTAIHAKPRFKLVANASENAVQSKPRFKLVANASENAVRSKADSNRPWMPCKFEKKKIDWCSPNAWFANPDAAFVKVSSTYVRTYVRTYAYVRTYVRRTRARSHAIVLGKRTSSQHLSKIAP